MSERSRMKPEELFPDDLTELDDVDVESLNSKVHRQLEYEYLQLEGPAPETLDRQAELAGELDRRDDEDGEEGDTQASVLSA